MALLSHLSACENSSNGGGDGSACVPTNDEIGSRCSDGIDNDCDGRTDCSDSGCASQSSCANMDGGTRTDGGSMRCATMSPENTVMACSDGCSNDDDNFADCNDFNCCGVVTCGPTTSCGRNDGGVRPDTGGMCATMSAENTIATCSDGCSNDSDSFVDCDDFDCCNVVACGPATSCGRRDGGTFDGGISDGGGSDAVTTDAGTADVSSDSPSAPLCPRTDSPSLVINEVDYDSVGSDTLEFVEIFNPTANPIALADLSLIMINGSDTGACPTGCQTGDRIMLSTAGITNLASNAYLVIRNSAVTLPMSTAQITVPSNTFQNGDRDGLALVNTATNTVLDTFSYEGSINGFVPTAFTCSIDLVEGTALAASDNSTTVASLSRLPNGTDTNNANADFMITTVPTPGAPNN